MIIELVTQKTSEYDTSRSKEKAQLLGEHYLKPALKAVIMFVRVLQKGFHKN